MFYRTGLWVFIGGLLVLSLLVLGTCALIYKFLPDREGAEDLPNWAVLLICLGIIIAIFGASIWAAEEVDPGSFLGKEACESCGTMIGTGDNFCAWCGEQRGSVCDGCKEAATVGNNYCPDCGSKINREYHLIPKHSPN